MEKGRIEEMHEVDVVFEGGDRIYMNTLVASSHNHLMLDCNHGNSD